MWFNALTCTIPWAIGLVIYWFGTPFLGIWALAIAVILIIFVPALIMCVLPRKYLVHWYIEFTEEGFTNSTLGRKRFYPWKDIVQVTTEQSPEFTGSYDDTLVIETDDKLYRFFLPDFGFDQKRKTVKFTDDVKALFTKHRKSPHR
jgi:hypothetical protein